MGDRNVTTAAAFCGCGCGQELPMAPAAGGRAPVYASRACRQRAYRTRTATAATPADPESVAGLLAAVHALGVVLDAGGRPDPAAVAQVREQTDALLARAAAWPPLMLCGQALSEANAEVLVSGLRRQGGSWARVAELAEMTEADARARWGHLSPRRRRVRPTSPG